MKNEVLDLPYILMHKATLSVTFDIFSTDPEKGIAGN